MHALYEFDEIALKGLFYYDYYLVVGIGLQGMMGSKNGIAC